MKCVITPVRLSKRLVLCHKNSLYPFNVVVLVESYFLGNWVMFVFNTAINERMPLDLKWTNRLLCVCVSTRRMISLVPVSLRSYTCFVMMACKSLLSSCSRHISLSTVHCFIPHCYVVALPSLSEKHMGASLHPIPGSSPRSTSVFGPNVSYPLLLRNQGMQ